MGGGLGDPQKMPIFWSYWLVPECSSAEHPGRKYEHIGKVPKIDIDDSEEVGELFME